MEKLDKILLGVVIFIFFVAGLGKLMALETDVKLFQEIANFVGYQGLWLMYITGGIEIIISILLFQSFLMEERNPHEPQFVTHIIGLVGVMGTMAGALAVHFVVIPDMGLHLAIPAALVLLIAAFLLFNHLKGFILPQGKSS